MLGVSILFSSWHKAFSYNFGCQIKLKIDWYKDKKCGEYNHVLSYLYWISNPHQKCKQRVKNGKIENKSDWPQIRTTGPSPYAWFLDQILFELEHVCLSNFTSQADLWHFSCIHLYYLSLSKILVEVAYNIERILRDFLWNRIDGDQMDHLVSWDVCCKPKDKR